MGIHRFSKVFIFIVIILLPLTSYANIYYYTGDSDPYLRCHSCYSYHCKKASHHKHAKKSYHKHSRYYYSQVDVYYPAYYPCGISNCGGYWVWVPASPPREYVTFSYKPIRYSGPEYVGYDNESYDMRTADDDVCSDPDMNNQY